MRPTLGVLIPYFNEGPLLREVLKSLFAQRQPPDEVLIYDDASTTPPEPFLDPAWKVRVLRGDRNVGPSIGRNRMLAESTTDFVHFHDADDQFLPGWAEKVRAALADGAPDAVFTEVSSQTSGCHGGVIGLAKLKSAGDLVHFCLLHVMLPASTTLRRSLVSRLGGYREDLWQSEDFEFHIRLAIAGLRYRIVDEPLVRITSRPESRSRKLEEVWTGRLQGLRLSFLSLAPVYYPTLAEAVRIAGSQLFRLGLRQQAREAFRFAMEIGPPTLETEPGPFRPVARLLGLEAAERLGIMYRRFLPAAVRNRIRRTAD